MLKKLLFVSVCFIYNSNALEADDGEEPICRMYLAPALNAGCGRGVFAGSEIQSGEFMDNSVTLAVHHGSIYNWQLNNYVWATDESDISMAEFGAGMLFNHRNPGLFLHKWPSHMAKASEQEHGHTTYTSVLNVAVRDIAVGEEIFVAYSDGNQWLEQRGIIVGDVPDLASDLPSVRSLSELKEIGHCLTHVKVKKSSIPFAGKGLFAMKNFKKGEIVTISPVMVIPKKDLEEVGYTTSMIIQNYCIASPSVSSIALFPFGLSAVANHARSDKANMDIDWYWWNDQERESKKNATAAQLSDAPFAQLDIAFRATKDISSGTELTYDYGEVWADSWMKHLAALNQWHLNSAWIQHAESHHEPPYANVMGSDKPQFLSFIGAPEGLFRPEWHDKPADPIVPPSEVTQAAQATHPPVLVGHLIEPVAQWAAPLSVVSQSRFLDLEAANFTGSSSDAAFEMEMEVEVDSYGAATSITSRSS